MANLVEFDDLKDILGLDGVEAGYPQLTLIMDVVKYGIQNYCNRLFDESTVTEDVDYYAGNEFIGLDYLPVSVITSIVFASPLYDYTFTNTEYFITRFGLRLIEPLDYDGKLTISYTGGYSVFPADFKRAALYQTIHEYQRRDFPDSTIVSGEEGSVTRPSLQLLDETKRVLDKYRHPLRSYG